MVKSHSKPCSKNANLTLPRHKRVDGVKKIAGVALAGAAVGTVIVVLSSGGSPDRPGHVIRPAENHEFDDFPLWREVPGRFAKIAEARLPDGTRWAAYVSRTAAGRRGRENPALTVTRITAVPGFGEYNHSDAGGPLAPIREGWSPVTAIMLGFGPYPGEGKGETFVAMSFKPSIASILIRLANGEAIREPTHSLNRYQRRKTHLPPLRYVALGLERELCIAKVVGYDADGELAFEGRYKKCHTIPFSYNSVRDRLRRIRRRSGQP